MPCATWRRFPPLVPSARFLMGRRPPAPPLRQQSPQAPQASSAVLSAAKHLLYSFPYFLWSQGHHHLSYRGSLLRTKSGNIPVALPCLGNSCPASVCKNPAPGQPGSRPPPPGREQHLQFIGPGTCSSCADTSVTPNPQLQAEGRG